MHAYFNDKSKQEPPSPLISWVNPSRVDFINNTLFLLWMRLLSAVWRKAILLSFLYFHWLFPLSACETSSGNPSIYKSSRERVDSRGPVSRKSRRLFRARKAIYETPTRVFCEAGLFICCKGNKNLNNCKVSCLETPLFWRYKENYVTRLSGLSRNGRQELVCEMEAPSDWLLKKSLGSSSVK